MLIEWFNAHQAVSAGIALADQFSAPAASDLKRNGRKGPSSRAALPLGDFLRQAQRHLAPLQLNFYKKAKLANSFKWRLLENGIERALADEVTQSLVTHLTLNRRLAAEAAEAAAPPKTKTAADVREPAAPATTKLEPLLVQADKHLAANEPQEAITCLRAALAQRPKHAVANNNLGAALCQLGHTEEAEQCLRLAIAVKPDYVDAHHNLALMFRNQSALPAAEQCERRVLKLQPSHLGARVGLGLTLLAAGRAAEAQKHLEKALRVAPRNLDALLGLGEIAVIGGDFDQAEKHFSKVLEDHPNSAGAWAALASLRKMTSSDAAWMQRAEQILSAGVSPTDEATLRFAMGKYCDDVADFDRAFGHYQRGNQILRSLAANYDGDFYGRFSDGMIAGYTHGAIAQAASTGSASETPVFVVGMMRSGTSLAEQIIASHPQARGAGELTFWSELVQRQGPIILQPPDASTRQKFAGQYLQLLTQRGGDAARVVDKFPANADYLGLIHMVFPKARIIYMRRNPIDACLSSYFQKFSLGVDFSFDLADLAHYYRQHRRLITHWKTVLPQGALLEVPYEALVSDPRAWTARMLEFIGLPWEERCLEFPQNKRSVATASAWQVRQKIYTGSVNRWRNYAKHIGPLRALSESDPSEDTRSN